jgi:hypothetical protein
LVDWRDPTRTEDWNKSWNMTSNIISCAQEWKGSGNVGNILRLRY